MQVCLQKSIRCPGLGHGRRVRLAWHPSLRGPVQGAWQGGRGWGGAVLLGRNTSQGEEPHTKGWSLVSLPLKQQETHQVCRAEGLKSPFMGRASCSGGVGGGCGEQSLGPYFTWGDSRELSWWRWPQQRDLVGLGVTLDYPPALIH